MSADFDSKDLMPHAGDYLKPRRGSSRSWTTLPPDLVAKVTSIFAEQFKVEAGYGEFLIEGRIYPDELIVRVGFLEQGRLKQLNFEASLDLGRQDSITEDELIDDSAQTEPDEEVESLLVKKGRNQTMQKLYVAIDAIGSLMEEYFESGEEDLDVPSSWSAYDFEGQPVHLRYSTVNSRLEQEADRLLGIGDDQLFHEEILPTEDALYKAEVDPELAKQVLEAIRSGRYSPQAAEASVTIDPDTVQDPAGPAGSANVTPLFTGVVTGGQTHPESDPS